MRRRTPPRRSLIGGDGSRLGGALRALATASLGIVYHISRVMGEPMLAADFASAELRPRASIYARYFRRRCSGLRGAHYAARLPVTDYAAGTRWRAVDVRRQMIRPQSYRRFIRTR